MAIYRHISQVIRIRLVICIKKQLILALVSILVFKYNINVIYNFLKILSPMTHKHWISTLAILLYRLTCHLSGQSATYINRTEMVSICDTILKYIPRWIEFWLVDAYF